MTLAQKEQFVDDNTAHSKKLLYYDRLLDLGIIDEHTRNKLKESRGSTSITMDAPNKILYINLLYKIVKDHHDNKR